MDNDQKQNDRPKNEQGPNERQNAAPWDASFIAFWRDCRRLASMGDSEAADVWRSSLIEQAVVEKGYSGERAKQLVDDLAKREPPDD